jgi:hypothetical protein
MFNSKYLAMFTAFRDSSLTLPFLIHFSEIDAGLKTLLELVNDDPESISPFVAFIKGVLDYLDKLEIDQIGALFDIFSRLALEVHRLLLF